MEERLNMLNEKETNLIYSKEWFRVAEVAQFLSVSESTIRNWISAGTLPVNRYGRLIIIQRSNLEKFLEEGRDNKNQ